jgi:hypothetical protein
MKLTVLSLSCLAVLPLAGCVSDSGVLLWSPPLPSSAIQLTSWVNSQRVRCVDVTSNVVAIAAPASDPRIRPSYARRCVAEFPRDMMVRNVEAACGVSFNIDAVGVPLATSTICNLGGASAEHGDQVMKMYIALAQRVATSQRFAPLANERTGAVRSRLVQRIRFNLLPSSGNAPPYPTKSAEVLLDQPIPLSLE